MRSKRRNRNRFYYRRRRRNFWPWIIFVVVSALFFWAIFQFFMVLFSNVRSESIAVSLVVEQGRAEFSLANNNEWSTAFSDQTFLEGESIRTARNSLVSLNFLDNNQIYLDSDTELKIIELTQKSSGETKAIFQLNSGQIWAQINDDSFTNFEKSGLVIETSRSNTYVRGTVFNLETDANLDRVSLIKGKVTVDVKGEDEAVQNIDVGVGQALEINTNTFAQLEQNISPLEGIDSEFESSDWYLDNLERQFPEEAATIRERIAPPVVVPQTVEPTDDSFTGLIEDPNIESPVFTAPVQGASISAAEDLVSIRGTAPAGAFQIQVNDYVLQRFEPGDRVWTYIASSEFGTLRAGQNSYQAVAITRDGKRSPIATLTINYEGTGNAPVEPAPTETPAVSGDIISVTDLKAPVVTQPALFAADPDATFETSAAVVTFSGEVDLGTQAVEVNDFRLTKFEAGDTTFRYIANANLGNMAEGENVYVIKAFDSDGNTSESQIKIFYQPIDIES